MSFDSPPAGPSPDTLAALRLELSRVQRELAGCHQRMEQMEGFFDHVADAVLIAEPDGQIIDANPAASALLGWSREELRSMRPWDFVTSASRDEILDTVQSLQNGEPLSVQRLCRTKEGGEKVMALRLARNRFGGRDLVIGSCRDVTGEHRAREALELALRETQALKERFRMAIDTTPGQIWSALPDGEIDFLNRRWLDYTGLTLDEARGWGWQAAIHPDDLPRLLKHWKSLLLSGKAGEMEARMRRHDGRHRWFLFRGVPQYDDAGALTKWHGQTIDIDDRKRAEALLEAEKRLLEMTAKGQSLPVLLDALCQLVEELSAGSLCSVLLLEAKTLRLWHGAAPSLSPGYARAIDGSVIGPTSGPCGQAAYFKTPVVVPDIAACSVEVEFRDLALAHGLGACFSTPILSSDGQVLGTFAIYGRKPGQPTAQHHDILDHFAHLASIAIERSRAEEQLRRSESSLARAQRLSAMGSFSWDAVSGAMTWSDETFRICGVDPAVKPTAEMTRDLIHPDDVDHFRRMLADGGRDFRFECRLLPPGGGIKHLEVAASAIRDGAGRLMEWLGSVVDITERTQAAEALRASEHLARGQLHALSRTLDALVREAEPDKLLEHVLRAIVDQAGAHSASVWDRKVDGIWLDLVAVIEGGRFQSHPKTGHPEAAFPILPQNHPVWHEMFHTGRHAVLLDIDQAAARLRVGADGGWHRVLEDHLDQPAMLFMKKHLQGMGVRSVLFVPMLIAGKVAGVIGVRFAENREFRREEIDLTCALAHQAMLAMQLMRLSQESRQSAVMAERNRMARDIHDTLAQGFTGVIVQLEAAADARAHGLPAEVEDHLGRAGELARGSLEEARRSVRALRPQVLEGRSLHEALEELFRKMTAGAGLVVRFSLQGHARALPDGWDGNLLRIGLEVLTNALRHARASAFETRLIYEAGEVRLELKDDGCGFDPWARHDGFGLVGMRQRVETMGGSMQVESSPGRGTSVLIALPLAKNAESLAS